MADGYQPFGHSAISHHLSHQPLAMRPDSGYSFIEITFVAGIIATAAAVATPRLLTAVDDFNTLGAARYISSTLQQARMEAVLRHNDVGVRFTAAQSTYTYAAYADGNANGI